MISDFTQGSSAAERQPHNLEVAGSTPAPAPTLPDAVIRPHPRGGYTLGIRPWCSLTGAHSTVYVYHGWFPTIRAAGKALSAYLRARASS